MECILMLLTSSFKEIQKQRGDTSNKYNTLKMENAQLRQQYAASSRENSSLVYYTKCTQKKSSNGKALVIGSNIMHWVCMHD